MTKPTNVDLHLTSSMEKGAGAPASETPLRLLVLGDFGGSTGGPVASRRILGVDRDNLEVLPGSLGVRASVELTGQGRIDLAFRTLEDFHPDRIAERVPVFEAMRDTRRKLEDPRTFVEAAKAVRAWAGEAPERPSAPPAEPASEAGAVMRDLLAGAARQPKRGIDASFEAELKEIVRPHLVPGEDPDRSRLLAAVEGVMAGLMRAILQDPRVKALEAAWRGLDLLVRRVDEEAVKLFVLDLSRNDLVSDLTAAESLDRTGLWRRLVGETVETPGAEPWGAVVALYEFGPALKDAALVARLAKLARAAGAPVLAGARPGFLGCESLAATPDPDDWRTPPPEEAVALWEAVRSLPEAAWVALALPRLLLRLPYGARTEPIESFAFEEMPGSPEHEGYLWGNPAFACALVLAGAFGEGGWSLKPETHAEIADLPTHIVEGDIETRITPPSEVVLTVRAAERILEAGLVPVLSLKGQDVVRVARLQSIASPPRMLAGRWEG